MNRRNWLKTAAGVLVAPAVVRAESLMQVRPIELPSVIVQGPQLPATLRVWFSDLAPDGYAIGGGYFDVKAGSNFVSLMINDVFTANGSRCIVRAMQFLEK